MKAVKGGFMGCFGVGLAIVAVIVVLFLIGSIMRAGGQ